MLAAFLNLFHIFFVFLKHGFNALCKENIRAFKFTMRFYSKQFDHYLLYQRRLCARQLQLRSPHSPLLSFIQSKVNGPDVANPTGTSQCFLVREFRRADLISDRPNRLRFTPPKNLEVTYHPCHQFTDSKDGRGGFFRIRYSYQPSDLKYRFGGLELERRVRWLPVFTPHSPANRIYSNALDMRDMRKKEEFYVASRLCQPTRPQALPNMYQLYNLPYDPIIRLTQTLTVCIVR